MATNLTNGYGISQREEQVIQLLCEGFTNKEIGEQLGISRRTVEGFRASAMDKAGVDSFAQLVKWAIRAGFVSAV